MGEVTNSVQGIFWRSFNKAAANTNVEQKYAERMPSTVHYTITFTDEYGDEHVTSLLSVDYKSECTTTLCTTYPDFATQSLEEHAESVNQSLGALPRGAIENKYVWAVGTKYDNTGKAKELTISKVFLWINLSTVLTPQLSMLAAKARTSQELPQLRSTVSVCSSRSKTRVFSKPLRCSTSTTRERQALEPALWLHMS